MFGLFRKEKTQTVRELLGNNDVRRLYSEFGREHLANAEGLILIWADQGTLFIETAGLSEAEILGAMQISGHQIMQNGVPRND